MKQSGLTGRASGITLLQREQCLPTHPALPTLPTLRRRFFGYTAPGPYVFNVARLPPDATTLLVLLLLLRITTTTTTTTTTLPTLSLVFSVFTVFSVFSISFNAESPPPHGPARHLPHQLTHERCGARRLPVPPLAPHRPHRPHRTVERSGGGRSCPPSPASPAPSAPSWPRLLRGGARRELGGQPSPPQGGARPQPSRARREQPGAERRTTHRRWRGRHHG